MFAYCIAVATSVDDLTATMILIVDDKEENLLSLKGILEANQFATETALSGEEALRMLLRNNYALIILDVQMPGMDGFEVAEAIGSMNKTRDIPIIFLSAVNTHRRYVTKGLQTGAVDYITKPADPEILILKVRNFYRLYEKTNALKLAEQELISKNEELNSTLESIPEIAFTIDHKGQIHAVNKHWFRYAPAANVFPETHPADLSFAETWTTLSIRQEPLETELRLKALDSGNYIYHQLRANPVWVQGELTRWVGTLTNINDQKLLSDTLERKVEERTRELLQINRELEISNHDLQQFAAVVSHDLQEPLRKIKVFGELIRQNNQLQKGDQQILDKMINASGRMTILIKDLLNFARLSEKGIFAPVSLNEIAAEVIADLELVVSEKQALIKLSPLPSLDGIAGLLRQLFQNLLSNALKFSKRGVPPEIQIWADLVEQPSAQIPASDTGNYCRIHFKDNGIGFDQQYADKIFSLFQRLNSREEYAGTGIGLAIAKKIVEKHNGVIAAKSEPGKGAEFILLFPFRQAVHSVSR